MDGVGTYTTPRTVRVWGWSSVEYECRDRGSVRVCLSTGDRLCASGVEEAKGWYIVGAMAHACERREPPVCTQCEQLSARGNRTRLRSAPRGPTP